MVSARTEPPGLASAQWSGTRDWVDMQLTLVDVDSEIETSSVVFHANNSSWVWSNQPVDALLDDSSDEAVSSLFAAR